MAFCWQDIQEKSLVTLSEDAFLDHSGLKLLPKRSFDVHAESLLVDRDYKLKEKILKIKKNAIIFEAVVSIVTLN